MSFKPWRDIAVPHEDVLKGTFQQAEFAADITQVHQGNATTEYQDPKQFFARTYITEGMRDLLESVMHRLAGRTGDPVIQLQTAFGGGKTHTLLAVYHLATSKRPVTGLNGVSDILERAEIRELPTARVAVIDGINLQPSAPKIHGEFKCHTLWGELAWQLGQEQAYKLVRKADEAGTSPDKDTLVELLKMSAPCVILMDELVAYYRQFQEGKQYPGGTFETNMTFIQVLTESLKSVPQTVLLASLPDSHNAGEGRGQVVLRELENYFRRLHKIWKPVTKEEAFSIVRRRLFERIDDKLAMEQVTGAFARFYISNKDDFPPDTQESRYLERLQQAYPIHPEIFDRLYEDWSTLERFQRTRGVLQLLAQIVHRLWKDGNADLIIMPGNLPLYDAAVRNKCLDYLPQGWDPVVDQDIDGEGSRPAQIDEQETRFGQFHAARRVARAIFLGSAPTTGRGTHGVEIEHVLLGTVEPDQPISVYKDALRRLSDRLNYINHESNRFWFDVTPNLRREMDTRKQRFNDRESVIPLLREQVGRAFARSHSFSGIHIFTPSIDVPDEYGVGIRLVVLPVTDGFSRGQANKAFKAAEEILRNRGEHPRQKQNRLIFLAPDEDVISRLKEQARIYLAWDSIVADISDEKLVLNNLQIRQAKQQRDGAEVLLRQLIRDAYKWLLAPREELLNDRPQLQWEALSVSSSALNLAEEIAHKLREEEWLITEWSPIHLANMLNKWYFKDGVTEVSALKVWQDTCQYLYLPRLANDGVLTRTIQQGVETADFFAYASAKEDDRYLGFAFGRTCLVTLDLDALLIRKPVAAAYKAKLIEAAAQADGRSIPDSSAVGTPTHGVARGAGGNQSANSAHSNKRRFYGSVELDPLKAKMQFATIADEVIQQFTTQVGIEVAISVEIQAKSTKQPFGEGVQRSVRENSKILKFKNAEFESDD